MYLAATRPETPAPMTATAGPHALVGMTLDSKDRLVHLSSYVSSCLSFKFRVFSSWCLPMRSGFLRIGFRRGESLQQTSQEHATSAARDTTRAEDAIIK